MSKVLFLDIDGVVNCYKTFQRHRGFIGIDPYMAFLVGKIQLDTNCDIVLSSTWRLNKESREEVKQQVAEFIDVTKELPSHFRGDEINEWLSRHPEVEKYAILDDDTDFYPGQKHFKTEFYGEGLTKEIAEAVTEYFNGDTK